MKSFIKENTATILSTIIGLVVFKLKFGFEKLMPSNISWLLNAKHDWGQHYLGWAFFKNESWHFPLGKIESYYYPITTNIGFTDSIPLFAIPFKLISKFLSDDFQYFGLWFLLCFILTAYFAVKISRKYNLNWLNTSLIALLITSNPVLLYRALHPALCAHWLILGSIYLYLIKPNSDNISNLLKWQYLLLVLSSLIHPYMVLMTFGFTLVLTLKVTFFSKKIKKVYALYYILFSSSSLFVIWYIIGYISFNKTIDNTVNNAFGLYSMNLNTFYNSFGFSSLLPNFKLATSQQYEGYMYLGVGLMVFIFTNIILMIPKIYKKQNYKKFLSIIPLFCFCVFCLLFSLTNKITFNDSILFEYKMPSIVIKLGNIFRASSRTFWVNYYLILIVSVILFSKVKIKTIIKSVFLFCIISLQLYDLQIFFKKKSYKPGIYQSSLNIERWGEILKGVKHLKTFPPYNFKNFGTSYEYQDLAYLSLKNGLTHTNAYVARTNRNAEFKFLNQSISDLIKKPISDNEVYVTNKANLSSFIYQKSRFNSNWSFLDGYYVFYSKNKKPLQQTKTEEETLSDSEKFLYSRSFAQSKQKVNYKQNIKHHIERIFLTENYIKINGWAFKKGVNDNSLDSLFLVIHNSNKTYVSRLATILREDVTKAFNKQNLDNSGIKSINYFNGIKKGSYQVSIGIKDKENNWSYVNLDKKVNILKSEPILPTPQSKSLPSQENIRYHFENIQKNGEVVFAKGWAFIKNKTAEKSIIELILEDKTGNLFKINTEPVLRPDVNKHFKQKFNYTNSGFRVEFKTSLLTKGSYKLGIKIVNLEQGITEFISTQNTVIVN